MQEENTNKDDIKKEEELSTNQRAFLAAYSQCGNITQAAELSDNARANHYRWLNESDMYKKAFEAAEEEAADRLESEARRRAVQGVEEPVFYQGVECGTVKKYSDNLLMFLMKGANPDKYADRVKSENKNANININEDASKLSKEDREKRLQELLQKHNKDK